MKESRILIGTKITQSVIKFNKRRNENFVFQKRRILKISGTLITEKEIFFEVVNFRTSNTVLFEYSSQNYFLLFYIDMIFPVLIP